MNSNPIRFDTTGRRGFLHRLGGAVLASLALPGVATAAVAPPNEVLIYTGFVAGYQYHAGPAYESQWQEGVGLQLVPEPENVYDEHAIALLFQGVRIGYVVMADNLVLSRMLTSELKLRAEILAYEPEAPTWERLVYDVYLQL